MILKFYQNLGKLFYAIAAADKKVQQIEFNTLKELVKKHWLNTNAVEDAYQNEAACQIEIVFDRLNKEDNLDAQACYQAFVDYKNEHPRLFTKTIKKSIMKTASKIAASFAGLNKSELIMLAKLDMELKNHQDKKQ